MNTIIVSSFCTCFISFEANYNTETICLSIFPSIISINDGREKAKYSYSKQFKERFLRMEVSALKWRSIPLSQLFPAIYFIYSRWSSLLLLAKRFCLLLPLCSVWQASSAVQRARFAPPRASFRGNCKSSPQPSR